MPRWTPDQEKAINLDKKKFNSHIYKFRHNYIKKRTISCSLIHINGGVRGI